MTDRLEVSEMKLLRGDIIETLYRTYGTDIRIAAIRNALRSKGLLPEEQLKKCIYYLGGEGKRYIHVEVNQGNWMDSLAWLNPVGVNLAEGDKDDVGVIFDEGQARNSLEVTERKMLRGAVIETLYKTYGTDIRIAVLRNALRSKGLILEDELKKCIFYLGGEQKEFTHVEVNQENWLDSLIWLNPVGVNLAEGDRDDMGVILNE